LEEWDKKHVEDAKCFDNFVCQGFRKKYQRIGVPIQGACAKITNIR